MLIGVNGIELYYEKTGQGRPLIMVHGNGEDHTIFDEAVGVLKENYTCYTVDSRGHGQSSPCKELHYKEMAQDIIEYYDKGDQAVVPALVKRDVDQKERSFDRAYEE